MTESKDAQAKLDEAGIVGGSLFAQDITLHVAAGNTGYVPTMYLEWYEQYIRAAHEVAKAKDDSELASRAFSLAEAASTELQRRATAELNAANAATSETVTN